MGTRSFCRRSKEGGDKVATFLDRRRNGARFIVADSPTLAFQLLPSVGVRYSRYLFRRP